MPRVSIVIPTYKRPELLPIAIESAIASERPAGYPDDWKEIVVVSDGDPDAREIVARYDGVVYHELPENKGQSAVLNYALGVTSGEYLTVLHDDDYIYPHRSQVLCAYLDDPFNGDAGLVCSQVDIVDGQGELLEGLNIRKRARHRERLRTGITAETERINNGIAGASVMYRRAMILDVGGWNEKLIHGEELTMHLGCLRTGWRVGMVDIATGVYRIYFGNKSRSCTDGGSTGKLLPKALALGKWQRAQIDYWGVNIVIASLGHRAHGLKRVVGEFRNKCEHMYLALHGYDSVPEWANHSNITARLSQDEGNNGTADKFTWNEEIAHRPGGGYIVHMDDDVLYPEDYVEVMRRKVDKFRKKAVVCAHGSRVTANPVNNFYDDRVNLHFKHAVKDNTPVHVPGIVCTAYHTDTISLKREDFIGAHTQDDIYMAVQCQKQQVPVMCIKRAAKWIVVNPDVSAEGSICQRYRGGCPDVSDTINSVQPLKLWTIEEGVVKCAASL